MRNMLIMILFVVLNISAPIAYANNNFEKWKFDNEDKDACIIHSKNPEFGKLVMISWIRGDDFMAITLVNSNWKFSKETRLPVAIDFNDNAPLNLIGYGNKQNLDIELPKQVTYQFLDGMHNEKKLRIKFKKANESSWLIDLLSVDEVIRPFVDCSRNLVRR